MTLLIVKPCTSGKAFDVRPAKRLSLDLSDVSAALKEPFDVRVSTPHVLFIACDSLEITLYKTGRLLVKNAKTAQDAEKAASMLYSALGNGL